MWYGFEPRDRPGMSERPNFSAYLCRSSTLNQFILNISKKNQTDDPFQIKHVNSLGSFLTNPV